VLAVCLYPSLAVLTAHDVHVVTMLLAGGQIDFLYLWRQATAVHAYLCLVISFADATCISGCANITDLAK
jgi:hypothetical protein